MRNWIPRWSVSVSPCPHSWLSPERAAAAVVVAFDGSRRGEELNVVVAVVGQ